MKKLYAIVLSLVMMFAFASTAMAADTVTLNVNGDEYTVAVTDGQSVYDVVKAWAGDRAEWKEVASDIGDGTGQVLISLDGVAAEPYNTDDEYEVYDPSAGDTVLDEANALLLKEFPTSGGLFVWVGDGFGMNRTGKYGVYAGEDWMFTINGKTPVDAADSSIELYMNQATVEAGDTIELTYGMVYRAFEM